MGAKLHKSEKKKVLPPSCQRCGNKGTIKSGLVSGKQRWKCKACNYQFMLIGPRGRPLWQKSLVVFLYSYGVSMHTIAKIFHVQPSTVLKWVRSYAKDQRYKSETGNVSITELKDMRRYLQSVSGKNSSSAKKSAVLCITINDEIFRKSLGIAITKPTGKR